jgi:hypothetical protein
MESHSSQHPLLLAAVVAVSVTSITIVLFKSIAVFSLCEGKNSLA